MVGSPLRSEKTDREAAPKGSIVPGTLAVAEICWFLLAEVVAGGIATHVSLEGKVKLGNAMRELGTWREMVAKSHVVVVLPFSASACRSFLPALALSEAALV